MPSLDTVVTTIGPVKAHVRPVAEEITERWLLFFIWGAPGRGTGDHSRGLALDFMTYELGGGVNDPGPERDWIGDQIAAYVLANRVRLNVAYVIWNRRIASALSGWAWRAYDGSNPHTDHVHVSFKATGTYEAPTPEDEDDMDQATFTKLFKGSLDDPAVRALVGEAVLQAKVLHPVTGKRGSSLETWISRGRINVDETNGNVRKLVAKLNEVGVDVDQIIAELDEQEEGPES